MNNYLLADELCRKLEKEMKREGINDNYLKALHEAVVSLEKVMKFW